MHHISATMLAYPLTWTEKEIRQQPDCWMKSLRQIDRQRSKINAFLAPILALKNVKIILTGAGTSAFIGDMLAPWLARHTGVNLAATPSTDLVTNPMDYLQHDTPLLLVSFARSGNSPESVAAVNMANNQVRTCYHLIITCNAQGNLRRIGKKFTNALVLLMPAECNDRGFAMTSSTTTMMASCLAVFAPETMSRQRFANVAERCRTLIAEQWNFHAPLFGVQPYRRVVYLGSGALQGVARESSLKVMELTAGKLAAFHDSPTGFRHGPKSLIDDETLVVVLISGHPYTRQYDLDLLDELRRDNQAMCVLAIADARAPAIEAGPHIYLPPSRPFIDIELAFCYLLYAQIFALSQSLKAGITPDTPCTTGTVNRVVQGVVIHPWPVHTTGE